MCRGSEFHEMLTMFAVSYMYPVQNSRARGHPHPVLAAELAASLNGQLDTLYYIILTYTNALCRRIDGSVRKASFAARQFTFHDTACAEKKTQCTDRFHNSSSNAESSE